MAKSESTAKYTILVERPSKRKCAIAIIICVILILVIIIVIIAAKHYKKAVRPLPVQDKALKFQKAAVAADTSVCSQIGSTILQEGRNAIDSAIATVFCLGVINLQSCGIGGGGFMVFYKRSESKFYVYDYREVAPANSTEDMYVNNTRGSRLGGLSIAVPGQVKGLYSIHQTHGHLSWSRLVEPAIKLAEEGFIVTKPLASAIKLYLKGEESASLRELLTKPDGKFYEENDLFKNPLLGKTLRNIQANGSKDFYEGDLARQIVADVQNASGIITLDDLKNYQIKERSVLKMRLPRNLTLQTMTAPGGGPIVAMIANIMAGFSLSNKDVSSNEGLTRYSQRVIEAMKFSYAQRGLFGDPSFLPDKEIQDVLTYVVDPNTGTKIREKITLNETHEPSYYGGAWTKKGDHGTSHLSILAENGDAVAVTETINYGFGSLLRSPVTGIIYNNEMDDFSTPGVSNLYGYPPTPANYIRPGKRPLSSMSPSIVTDKNGDVKLVVGASGGSRIISGTANVLLGVLFLQRKLGAAVSDYRFHHQGIPNIVTYFKNESPPEELVESLKKVGHDIQKSDSMSVVQAIYRQEGSIYAMSDERKEARAAGY